jgi:hypothetical protein
MRNAGRRLRRSDNALGKFAFRGFRGSDGPRTGPFGEQMRASGFRYWARRVVTNAVKVSRKIEFGLMHRRVFRRLILTTRLFHFSNFLCLHCNGFLEEVPKYVE